MKNELKIFEQFRIRRHFDETQQKWFFSAVDIVAALTQQNDFQKARKYWNKLKERLAAEGSQLVTICHQLKMLAEDGKLRATDVADLEAVFRLIQSIPSPKAEPIKMWLAKVGNERIQEISDPEQSLNRARQNWQKHGYHNLVILELRSNSRISCVLPLNKPRSSKPSASRMTALKN
jgi:DNA-damage-inducible protein D